VGLWSNVRVIIESSSRAAVHHHAFLAEETWRDISNFDPYFAELTVPEMNASVQSIRHYAKSSSITHGLCLRRSARTACNSFVERLSTMLLGS